MSRKKILFVAEAVTLAQVVRLVRLAQSLPTELYDVHFASAQFDPRIFAGTSFKQWPIPSRSASEVERDVAAGRRIYSTRILSAYVKAELALFSELKPELVVGDLRWSLCVSAPAAGIPYASLINAYWSPFAVQQNVPLPDHPIIRLLGEENAAKYFPQALPFVFKFFVRPINALRKRYGLEPVAGLRELLALGDWTLYPDVPELVPCKDLPSRHLYLGHVAWAPKMAMPQRLQERSSSRPLVYVTMGSSGRVDTLSAVVQGLLEHDVDIALATAGRSIPGLPVSDRVYAEDFLPGDILAQQASLVVSNGGSTTGYQALAAGVPVLGLPTNLDQFLASQAITDFGAGKTLPARKATSEAVALSVAGIWPNVGMVSRAQRAKEALGRIDSASVFQAVVAEAVGQKQQATA